MDSSQQIDEVWEVVSVMVEALRHALELLHRIEARQDEILREVSGGR